MTEERTRAPWSVRTTTPDLFEVGERLAAPSANFEARAAIWRDYSAGLISMAEATRRSAAIGVPQKGTTGPHVRTHVLARPRHSRPAPAASRQYSPPIATTAMRDDRLTPGARALLVVLRARCGKGRVTDMAKGTLAAIMSRSTRTIARYLRDLERFGYVVTETRRTARGFHTGLVISLTDAVLPFWSEAQGLARWLGEASAASFRPFAAGALGIQGMTVLSPKNQFQKDHIPATRKIALKIVNAERPAPG